MLELAILGLLKERPMHGYDIRKHLQEDFGVLSNVSFGSLYPALGRLEAADAVSAIAATPRRARDGAEVGVPLTGSLGGERAVLVARRATAKAAAALGARGTRARKVYEITPKGEELFEQLLVEPLGPSSDGRSFSLRLAFARHLSPAARVRMFERRRMQLADRLERATRGANQEAMLDRYERSIKEHGRRQLAADLAWIEQLLADEQDGAVDSKSAVVAAAVALSSANREEQHSA